MRLKEILDEIQKATEKGERKVITRNLKKILTERKKFIEDCKKSELYSSFSEALYKALLLELDEKEEDSIEAAEIAYVSVVHALNNKLEVFNRGGVKEDDELAILFRSRILLLHFFNDYLLDTLVEIFLKKYRKENILLARNLADECLKKMQIVDVMFLEDHFGEFIDDDDQLSDVYASIDMPLNLNEKEMLEASTLHKVLFAYLKVKYNF